MYLDLIFADEMDREDSDGSAAGSAASKISSEEFYVNIMKKMQFGK